MGTENKPWMRGLKNMLLPFSFLAGMKVQIILLHPVPNLKSDKFKGFDQRKIILPVEISAQDYKLFRIQTFFNGLT